MPVYDINKAIVVELCGPWGRCAEDSLPMAAARMVRHMLQESGPFPLYSGLPRNSHSARGGMPKTTWRNGL